MSDTNNGDLLEATPRNIRRLYPEHGNNLMAVAPSTGDEFSVNPGDYADFADMDDDEPMRGGEDREACVLALRQPGFMVLTANEGEPAYTVVGVYFEGDDAHQRYATTVYTLNGPEAAEQLAQEACREDNQAETGDDLIEIAAVIEGEVKVIA